ncbi:hypothetical protein PIB30_095849 [Stylosanthes scabra]|uniref:Uncharacterized protein n=1 Tax=Stylosanthes scabra TaxID=79078 RepID=A0ABU6TWG7_9FABA|nr:hypothetical protein [Stylosanthes scabra]
MEAMACMDGGGDHYSPTTSDGHNFRSGTPIDSPFVPTRSLFCPLRFYTNKKATIDDVCASGACG